MINSLSKKLPIIDKLIFAFLALFIATLNNSIFFEQVGYFGALLLSILRLIIAKENSIKKNSLEIPFILYFVTVLIAGLFSVEVGDALEELVKNLLLIPILYVIPFYTCDEGKAKKLLQIYLAAALLTAIVYLFFAYNHYSANLYRIEGKGPSPFQYVMTAGGLMMMSALMFFALAINEKVKKGIKAFYYSGFIILSFAIIASYTRAAWMGTFAGLLLIIILKKKWWLTAPVILGIVFLLIFSKSFSRVYQFSIEENKLPQERVFETEGSASRISVINDTVYVADYEEGVETYVNGKKESKLQMPSPATMVKNWRDRYFFCYTMDSRIYTLYKNTGSDFSIVDTFISPGVNRDLKVYNQSLYVADKDSGLTIYLNPQNSKEYVRLNKHVGLTHISATPEFFIGCYTNPNSIKIFRMKNSIPVERIDSMQTESPAQFAWIFGNEFFVQDQHTLAMYVYIQNKLEMKKKYPLAGVMKIEMIDSTLYMMTGAGSIFRGKKNLSGYYDISPMINLNEPAHDFEVSNNKLYVSTYKRNRLASMFDIYHDTNFERLSIWKTGIRIFKDHPIIGVGDIDLGDYFRTYKDYFFKENYGHLHNNFLQWLVTLGIVGFVVIIFLMYKIFIKLIRIYKNYTNNSLASSVALGTLAGFVAFLIAGLGEYNYGDQEIITVVWFLIGLNLAFFNLHKKSVE